MTRLLTLLCLVLALAGCLKPQTVKHASLFPDYPLLDIEGYADDAVLRYETREARSATPTTPILFVHGFGSTLETWQLVVPTLSYEHPTVAVDLKGFGRSSKYDGDYTAAGMARTLVGALDSLGYEQVDVVAHSYGCSIALALALHYPERVRRLVLTDAFAYSDQLNWYLAWSRSPVVGELLFALYYNQQLDYRLGLSFYDPRMVSHEMVGKSRELLQLPGTKAAALAVIRGLHLEEAEQNYWALEHPTLVIWGEEDQVTNLRYGQRLAQHLPNARLETIRFAGHFPMVEASGHYAQLVASFLAEPAAAQREVAP